MKRIILIFVIFLLSSCFTQKSVNDVSSDNFKNKGEYSGSGVVINDDLNKKKLLNNYNNNLSKYGVLLYRNGNEKVNGFIGDKNLCKKHPDLYICKLINKGFFKKEFYYNCLGIKNISYCDKLNGDKKIYCKSDSYLANLFLTKDIKICDNFKNNYELGDLMASKKFSNKEFCLKFYNNLISKNKVTEIDIKNFVKDIEPLDKYKDSVTNMLNFLFLGNYSNLSFYRYLEVEYRKNNLECNKLNNSEYLLQKLKGIKYIFDSEIQALESYNFLGQNK